MYTLAQTHQIEPLKEVNFLLCRLRFSKAVQNVHGGSSFCPGVASCFRRRRAEVGLVIAVLFVCVKPQCLLPPKPTAGEQGAATGVRGLSETASPVACLVWCRPTSRFLVLKRTVRALAGLRREVGCACERGSRCPPGDPGEQLRVRDCTCHRVSPICGCFSWEAVPASPSSFPPGLPFQ